MTDIKYTAKKLIKNMAFPIYNIMIKHFQKHNFYQNINLDTTRTQKRVLISYITYPFDHNYKDRIGHTSWIEAPLIIKAFTDRDCVVDVIACTDSVNISAVTENNYDYIFGFGRPWRAAVQSNPQAKAIMYLTESAPWFSEKHEQERLDYYASRHGKRLPLTRSNKYFLDEHIKMAQIGCVIGNAHTAGTYSQQFSNMKLQLLAPSGFFNREIRNCPYSGNNHSFLWFGSWGAIHKGLDILLDVFAQIPEAKLYIAGLGVAEKWLLADYEKAKNIIDVGYLDVQSNDFLALVEKVTFCIMPSASEGMSTSVLTCMRHGLIPVVTPNCGIDIEDYGYLIEDYHVEAVSTLVKKLLQVPAEELELRREAVFKDANQRYSLEAFADNMRRLVSTIVVE